MDRIARMIDANANRAREALRVMEDVARFGLDHAGLCERIKGLRHGLGEAIAQCGLDDLKLLASRDTAGDVGTSVTTPSEGDRDDGRAVAAAACKRLTEALRVIEESVKVVGRDAAPASAQSSGSRWHGWEQIEALRYRAYEIERELMLALGTGRGTQWRLCVLVTESMCARPWEDVVEGAVAGGADCVQVREKELEGGELLCRARRVVEICRGKAAVVINDRPDIALLCGADGVHVGQGDLPIASVRQLAGSRLLVGVSTHDLGEARAAVHAGADYCGIGAMFSTKTKARETSGVAYLRQYLADPALARVPHLAIGGIMPENVAELVAAGCKGIAVSGVVCGGSDPERVCRDLLARMSAQHTQVAGRRL